MHKSNRFMNLFSMLKTMPSTLFIDEKEQEEGKKAAVAQVAHCVPPNEMQIHTHSPKLFISENKYALNVSSALTRIRAYTKTYSHNTAVRNNTMRIRSRFKNVYIHRNSLCVCMKNVELIHFKST